MKRMIYLIFLSVMLPVLGMEIKKKPVHLAILVSGKGTNMEAILKYFEEKDANQKLVKPCLVVSNRKNARALKVASGEIESSLKRTIPIKYIPSGIRKEMGEEEKEEKRKKYALKLMEALLEYNVTTENGLVCCAGFMLILHKDFINVYKNRILNIHPSLLPSFPGINAIKQAMDYGVKVTGPTIHYIDEGVDTGNIIAQEAFKIGEYDTLEGVEASMHATEHKLYPKTIKKIVKRIQLKRVNQDQKS